MQKLAACLLLLLVAICAYGQQLQDLGTVSLPSTIDAIGIVSQEFKVCFLQKICKICKTDLIIETSTDNTFSVAIKANGLSGKNAQQLVKVVGNNITITAVCLKCVYNFFQTAANLANHGASSSVLTTLACFALVPLVTRSKFSIGMFFVRFVYNNSTYFGSCCHDCVPNPCAIQFEQEYYHCCHIAYSSIGYPQILLCQH